jgi:hypothetical protein
MGAFHGEHLGFLAKDQRIRAAFVVLSSREIAAPPVLIEARLIGVFS